jgi:hypothetical protein
MSTPLSERLSDDLKKALKSGDRERVSVIRMIMAAVKNKEIDKRAPLDDVEIQKVLLSIVRQRKDSIEQFSKGGRQDLVDKEARELSIVQSYLPEQLTEQEIKEIISRVIEETGAQDMKDMGRVMKGVMEKTKGLADGKAVSQLVRERLSGGG